MTGRGSGPALRTGATRLLLLQLPCLKRRLCQTLGVASARPEVANRWYGTAFGSGRHELADRT